MKDVNKTYDNLRRLAIIDARRRLNIIKSKVPEWDIVDKVQANGDVEKVFSYTLGVSSFVNITLNEYAVIREIKYIVWRFDIRKEEMAMKEEVV